MQIGLLFFFSQVSLLDQALYRTMKASGKTPGGTKTYNIDEKQNF